jgi:hypothetical protein
MHSSMTRAQECAFLVIAISMVAIIVAAPILTSGPDTSWRAKAATGLAMLEALITAMRRMLGM